MRRKQKSFQKILSLLMSLGVTMSLLSACGGGDTAAGAETIDEFKKVEKVKEATGQANDMVEVVNTTKGSDTQGNGLVKPEAKGTPDANPKRSIARATGDIPQVRAVDMRGNTLGDEYYLYRGVLSASEQKAYDQVANAVAGRKDTVVLSVAVPINRIEAVLYAVYYDHPEFFYMEGGFGYSYNGNNIVTELSIEYSDLVNQYDANAQIVQREALQIATNASRYQSKAEQAKYVHDAITNRTDYVASSPYNQSCYSVFANNQTVCAGYARAYQYCLQLLGIPCVYMVGYAGEDHAWNMIQLDGEYYNVDVTWDDPLQNPPNQYYYDYFNITDNTISADHQRNDLSVYLPAAQGTKYSYRNYFNGQGGYDLSENALVNPSTVTTPTQTVVEDDEFDWDGYYDDYDWETDTASGNMEDAEGYYDADLDTYVYYDPEYDIFYFYDESEDAYYGFDDSNTYIQEDGEWYYLD